MTSKPTHSTIREFILNCYTPDAIEEVAADRPMEPDQEFVLVGGQNNQELSSTNLFKELDKNTLKNLSITKSEKLEINDNLSLEDLEILHESFEKIGYFELTSGGVAEVTGSAKRIAKNLFGDR